MWAFRSELLSVDSDEKRSHRPHSVHYTNSSSADMRACGTHIVMHKFHALEYVYLSGAETRGESTTWRNLLDYSRAISRKGTIASVFGFQGATRSMHRAILDAQWTHDHLKRCKTLKRRDRRLDICGNARAEISFHYS